MNHSPLLSVRYLPVTDKRGNAMDRASRQSSFLDDPNAKFLDEKVLVSENPPVTRRVESTSQALSSTAMGVGEGAHSPPLPLRPHPGFKCKAVKDVR